MYNTNEWRNPKNFSKFIEIPDKLKINIEHEYTTLTVNDSAFGFFSLTEQKSCCGSLFLSNINNQEINSKHLGTLLTKIAIRMAELGSYSSVSCIIPTNSQRPWEIKNWEKMKHIVEKLGFKELTEAAVVNSRTGATLRFYQLKLEAPWVKKIQSYPRADESAIFKQLEGVAA